MGEQNWHPWTLQVREVLTNEMGSLPMRWAAGSLGLRSVSESSSGSSPDSGRGRESTVGGRAATHTWSPPEDKVPGPRDEASGFLEEESIWGCRWLGAGSP